MVCWRREREINCEISHVHATSSSSPVSTSVLYIRIVIDSGADRMKKVVHVTSRITVTPSDFALLFLSRNMMIAQFVPMITVGMIDASIRSRYDHTGP